MINLELNQQMVRNQQESLAVLFVSHPETKKRIKKIVREELKKAAKRMQQDIHAELKNDPRQAYKAVKFSIYKRIMGGNMSILSRRRGGARYELRKSRKLDENPRQRGGNRRLRSTATRRMDTYFGADRSFVLRFLNSGTKERNIYFKSDPRRSKYDSSHNPNTGYRKFIAPRDLFEGDSQKEMEKAAMEISAMIEDELAAAYKEINKT